MFICFGEEKQLAKQTAAYLHKKLSVQVYFNPYG